MVAAMALTNGPLQQLITWATGPADALPGRRAARRWGTVRPALAGYQSVGEVVRGGWSDTDRATVLIAELAALSERDGVATQAALAILAPRLAALVGRWARCGVPVGDLEDLEAHLVCETLEWLRSRREPTPPGAIVDLVWGQVRSGRRRHRRVADRQVTLDATAAAGPETPTAVTAAAAVVDAFRAGRLSLPAAQALWATGVAGWSAVDAADRLGCRPDALRARRSRAIRALAA
jgi:DNA-directed RNA polymerase specialized sigma24 family protein